MIELVSKAKFNAAYREYMENGGHSYDEWDRAAAWSDYQIDPTKYEWLNLKFDGHEQEN